MSTALDIIKGALRRINSYQAGDPVAPQDADDCLAILNDLLGSWSGEQGLVVGTNEYILQWNVGQSQYKIGNPTCTDLGEPNFLGLLIRGVPAITGAVLPSDLRVG